jgi:hypothetical protein
LHVLHARATVVARDALGLARATQKTVTIRTPLSARAHKS